MEILDHEDERAIRSECPEQAADRRKEDVDVLTLGSHLDRLSDLGCDVLPVMIVGEQLVEPPPGQVAGRLDDGVSHGMERDTLTWRRTTLDDGVCVPSDRGNKFSSQPRLADSCVAEHGESPHATGTDHLPEGRPQAGQLVLAAEHWSVERAGNGRCPRDDLEDLPPRRPSRSALKWLHDYCAPKDPLG